VKNVATWIFWSRQNLALALAGLLVLTIALLALVVSVSPGPAAPSRAGADQQPPVVPSSASAPPVSPTPSPSVPLSTVGQPEPIALEAADAVLGGDLSRFGRVALPAAVQAVSEADTAALRRQDITGQPQVVDGSRADEITVEVPITEGTLQMIMGVSQSAWKVSAIRYVPARRAS
jgi:hypothetical protein